MINASEIEENDYIAVLHPEDGSMGAIKYIDYAADSAAFKYSQEHFRSNNNVLIKSEDIEKFNKLSKELYNVVQYEQQYIQTIILAIFNSLRSKNIDDAIFIFENYKNMLEDIKIARDRFDVILKLVEK